MPNGFSYLQVLLVVAVITILGAVAAPYYVQFQSRQQLSETADRLLMDARYTQAKSMQREKNNQWGLHINDADKAYVLFYGSSYVPNQANNQTIEYSASLTVSPNQDIIFSPTTGLPASATTITVQSSTIPNDVKTIQINAEGLIQLQ